MTSITFRYSPTMLSILCLTIVQVLPLSRGHSFMLSPRGDFKSFNKAECRIGGPQHAPNDNCPGPCFAKSSFQYNKDERATVYRRGQMVSMVWAKNNHRGGFVRFSLVPRDLRMSAAAHNELAFRYACFESDLHRCTDENCGTDRESMAYRTMVEIPTSYPDGEYTLGWAWYGGTVGQESLFGDYYGCSSVEIRGGEETASYERRFIAGENVASSVSCSSATNRVGMCVREPCVGFAKAEMVPAEFSENRRPLPIEASWLRGSLDGVGGVSGAMSGGVVEGEVDERGMVEVRELVLIHAATGGAIGVSKSNSLEAKVSSREEGISFVALVDGSVGEVRFYLNGRWVRTEVEAPYAFWGDRNEGYEYNAWGSPIFGREFEVKVVAVGRDGRSSEKVFRVRLE